MSLPFAPFRLAFTAAARFGAVCQWPSYQTASQRAHSFMPPAFIFSLLHQPVAAPLTKVLVDFILAVRPGA